MNSKPIKAFQIIHALGMGGAQDMAHGSSTSGALFLARKIKKRLCSK
jgi:hypothetical protein